MVKDSKTDLTATGRLPIGWVIGVSMALAAAPELLGRFLYQAYRVEYGVTGMLTLLAMVLWGASAVYVIQRAHGMPRVTRTLFAGVCLMVFSQSLSMSEYFQLPGIVFLMSNVDPFLDIMEDSCFVLGLAAIFAGFYLSVIEAARANALLQKERAILANQVTERTQALEASQGRYRDLIQHMTDAVWRIDMEGRFTFVSPAVEGLSGYTPEELLGGKFQMALTAEGARAAEASLASRLSGSLTEGFLLLELEHRRKDGSTFLGEVSTRTILDSQGRVVEIQGITRDITERKRADQALQNRLAIEELVATISGRFVNLAPPEIDAEITRTVATVGRFMKADHAFVALFSPDGSEISRLHEWLGDGISEHQFPRPPLSLAQFTWLTGKIRRGENLIVPRIADTPPEAAPERAIWDSASLKSTVAIPVVLGDTVGGFLALDSIYEEHITTEEDVRLLRLVSEILSNALLRQRAHQLIEEQRNQFLDSAKMSILGEMASNVAHEINNPLAIVLGSAEQLRNLLGAESEQREHVPRLTETIVRNVSRIQTIVKGLRIFARKGEHDPFRETPVRAIVDDTVVLCRERFVAHNAALNVEPMPDAMTVDCRPTQIMEVLFNLLSNALYAVENSNEKWVTIAAFEDDSNVTVAVTDSGCGVPPEIAKTMFDRFVTSKDFGKGTGLGLNISKRIAMTHNGTLTLDASCPNTRFVIRLPKRHHAPNENPPARD